MNGQSKTNERLHDITPNGMVIDVSVSPNNKCQKEYATHI
jgi:hypothetical protein